MTPTKYYFTYIFKLPVSVSGISTSSLETRLTAAETNISDLSDSIYRTCNVLDELGAAATSQKDCCIAGDTSASSGDRDRFICLGRTAAGLVGIDTAATCPVCPSSLNVWSYISKTFTILFNIQFSILWSSCIMIYIKSADKSVKMFMFTGSCYIFVKYENKVYPDTK